MANYSNLLAQIAANIYSNDNQEITGDALQLQLNAMIASLGAGYQFMGVANAATNPGTPDQRVFYISSEDEATYVNFSNIKISKGEIAILKYDTEWTKLTISYFASPSDINTLRYNISVKELPILAGYGRTELVVDGLLGSDGTIRPIENYKTSRLLEIPSGTTKISWYGLFPNTGGNAGLNLYDSNGTFIASVNTSSYSATDGNSGDVDITTYTNAKFLRFSAFGYDDTILSKVYVICGNGEYDINSLLNGYVIANISAPAANAAWRDGGLDNMGNIFVNFSSPGNAIDMGIRDMTAAQWLIENIEWNETWRYVEIPSGHEVRVYSHSLESSDVNVSVKILPVSGLQNILVSLSQKAKQISSTIHIGPGLDYETLRDGITAAYQNPNTKVYVHPGTYDLITEFSSEIAAHTGSHVGNLVGNGMHIIFLPGAYVKANYSPSGNSEQDNWVCQYFEPFRTDATNFILENLDIEASNTRYCVHDELAGAVNSEYVHKFVNCKMRMSYTYQAINIYGQCIGGGIGQNAYIEITGGYYEGAVYGGQTYEAISYHNGNNVNADSVIFIKDIYVAGLGFVRFGAYGQSTIPVRMYVSNCSFGAAIVNRQEISGGTSVLADLIEWNNTIRN